MIYMEQLILVYQLDLPLELIKEKIIPHMKYEKLEKTIYKKNHKELIRHFQYYCWLNKKINRLQPFLGPQQTLFDTLKEFDYYRKKPQSVSYDK